MWEKDLELSRSTQDSGERPATEEVISGDTPIEFNGSENDTSFSSDEPDFLLENSETLPETADEPIVGNTNSSIQGNIQPAINTGKGKAKPSKVKKPKEKRAGAITNDKVSFLSSIKVKLFVAFLLPIFLFIIAGIMIYSKCSSSLVENCEASTYTTLTTLNEYFESGFEAAGLIGTRLSVNSATSDAFSGTPTDAQVNACKVAVSNEATADYLVANITIIGDGFQSVSTDGLKKESAYKAFADSAAGQYVAQSENDFVWISSHPELDEAIGYDSEDYALSGVMKFKNRYNKFAGYIIIDIQASYVQNILDNADFGDGSYVGLITDSGDEVISGSTDFSFYGQDFYQEIAAAGESGSSDIHFNGDNYLFVYTPLTSANAIVCALVPESYVLAGVKTIQFYLIAAIVICAVTALLIGNLIANSIGKAIVIVNKTLKKTSNGDLTSILALNRKDEFKALSFNISNMVSSMKNLIQKMTHVSGALSQSAVMVGDNAQTLLDVTKNITDAVGYIDDGISQQSSDTENCLHQMADLAGKINVVQENTAEINELTATAQTAIDDGIVIVSELGNRVQDTTHITKEIIKEINELTEDSMAINGIIGTIEEIAEETNLLALNASIEAARAGDAGRGFAVVSDNIRKFAERSSDAASQISSIIGKLQERMQHTITTAGKAEDIVTSQEHSLNSTVDVFNQIKDHVGVLAEDISSISDSIKGIEVAKNDTMLAIESISATSNQTEAAASELNKSVEKQLHSVEELNEAVKKLQDNALDLDSSVSIFKIE